MMVIESLDSPLPPSEQPISLTIGSFDGVHLGHQAILDALTGTKVVISFTNHPTEVLFPDKKVMRLCSPEEKVQLIKKRGVDYLYLIPFTQEFSSQSPQQFLASIRQSIPFDKLILGEDATIGKNRSGTQEVVRGIAKEIGFDAIYIKDIEVDGIRPSSSLIRTLIAEGKQEEAEKLLGRCARDE